MSLPKFPEKDNMPSREEVINQIISSIAMEELGLSHIINAEGEKLQYALGTLEGTSGLNDPLTMEELLKLNESVTNTLNSNMMNQFFLKEKLVKALSAAVMQGPPGPEGPRGPATIDVDPKVDTLDPGSSPTVENTGSDNQHVMLKFGIPKGDTGDVGTILDSFDTLAELEAAHPTGNQGDAYLVDGTLYIWDTKGKKWKSTGGNLRGPAGPQGLLGPQGIQGDQGITGPQGRQGVQGIAGTVGTLKASYESLGKLIEEHPTGAPGDMYYVEPDVYVWDADADEWSNVGRLSGPQGIQGPQGPQGEQGPQGIQGEAGTVGTLKASYETLDKLKEAHPTGLPGDMYYVEPDVYVWDADADGWVNVGRLSGPQGIQGKQGAQGVQGMQGEQGVQGQQGPQGIQGPPGAGAGIIPFATGYGDVGLLDSRNNFATNVIFSGFGMSSDPVSITGTGFMLPSGDNFFFPISLAHAITIKRINFTTANWATFNPGAGATVIPYIILAMANQGETTFNFLVNTRVEVTEPWSGGSNIPANSTLYGFSIQDINQTIPVGARLAICCAFDMKNGNPPLLPHGYYFYYAGSIYYE